MKSAVSKKLVYTTVLAGLAAPSAFAQQDPQNPFFRNRYVAVIDRPQPEFDPPPLRTGAFEINSSLLVGANYNDNVYATDVNPTEDTFLQFRPEAEIRSTWSRNQLYAGFNVDHREYSSEDSETVTDSEAYVGGRLDVQRNFSLAGRASSASLTEMRYDPASPNAALEPTHYDRVAFTGNATWRPGRVQLDANIGSVDLNYDDIRAIPGAAIPIIDQDFRDVTETYYGGRASYAMSPSVAVFAQGRITDLDYDAAGTALVPSRDGSRTSAQVGVNFELTAPFRGDIAVGYIEDDKDSPLLADFDGFSVDGNLSWFPTQLTTVTFRGSRSVYDPGILNSATAALTIFGAHIDHELRRNIIVFGDVQQATHDFQGIDREDDVTSLSAGLGYKLNRNIRLDFQYSLYSQDSSGTFAGRDLDQNIVSASLRFFP